MGKPVESRIPPIAPEASKKAPDASSADHDPEDDVEMTFLDHLRELRTRLVRSLWGFIPGMAIAWYLRETILEFLAAPYMHAYRTLGQGEPTLHFGIVTYCPGDRYIAGTSRADAADNQLRCVDQQPGTHTFLKTMFAQISYSLANHGKAMGKLRRNRTFMSNDGCFDFNNGVAELQADKTLPG